MRAVICGQLEETPECRRIVTALGSWQRAPRHRLFIEPSFGYSLFQVMCDEFSHKIVANCSYTRPFAKLMQPPRCLTTPGALMMITKSTLMMIAKNHMLNKAQSRPRVFHALRPR